MTVVGESFEVVTMGRVGVDLYPEQIGVPLEDVRTFRKSLGGSPTNVAVAAARLGHRAAVITKVGNDGFGKYVRAALRSFGVDDRFVGTHAELLTPVVFAEVFPPNDFPLHFYRQPTAPDMTLSIDELDLDTIREAEIFWTTGTGLSDEPSRSTTLAALRARDKAGHTVHDLDYRPMLWPSLNAASQYQTEALAFATVAVGNQDESAVVVGEAAPSEQARRLLDLGVEWAIVKLGPEGVFVASRSETAHIPAVEVEIVCGLGAGDAFGGAVCHGLLRGWGAAETVAFANAAGAHVAARLACADEMPTEEQVRSLMAP
ncbi:MAG: 5-dehydro-2-deoxygluconokinase [Acidimicrobiia bacterium]